MIRIGKTQRLTLYRQSPHGWYLADQSNNEVLLPNKFCDEDFKAGQELEVFIFRDSEQRLTATTQQPKLKLYRFALLEIVATSRVGAFADMGLEKHLLIPFKEMHERLEKGQWAMIYMFLDNVTERLVGSARVTKWLERENIGLKKGDKVFAQCFETNSVGYRVIINNQYQGIFYRNEITKRLKIGDCLDGYVESIRPDGSIDLNPQALGREKISPLSQMLLNFLKENDGFYAITDKADPKLISDLFGISKRAFKETVGALYKAELIYLSGQGIYLTSKGKIHNNT